MEPRVLTDHHPPLSALAATLVLYAYLLVARADGILPANSMFGAIFRYGISADLAVAYALRSALVWILAFSLIWFGLAMSGARRDA